MSDSDEVVSTPRSRRSTSASATTRTPRKTLRARIRELTPDISDEDDEVVVDDDGASEPTPSAPSPSPSSTSSKFDRLKSKVSCLPSSFVYAIITFIALWAGLFVLSPKFVCRKEGDRYLRDNTKVFFWSLGLGVAVGVGMMVYGKYRGTGAICSL